MDSNKTVGLRASGLSHSHVGAIGWEADGPAAGYFPFRVGAILCIAAANVVVRSLFGQERDHRVFVTWERLRLVLMVLVPTLLYILAIHFVGIYVASAVFIAGFMRAMDKRGWLNVALVSLGVAGCLFWMFEKQFMVPLPKGPLEALFGL